MKTCSICQGNKHILTHHLSYEPEIKIDVCHICHDAMHRLAKLQNNQQDILVDLVRQYGNRWEDSGNKYAKSKHWKDYAREWHRSYDSGYYFKNLSPDKFLKRMDELKRKIKLIEKGEK